MRVDIRSTLLDDRRFTENLRRRAMPLAIRNSLNDVAFDVRRTVVGPLWSKSFNVRNRQFPRAAFRVKKATRTRLVSELFDRFDRDWLRRQASGGTRRARGGRYLAIPLSYVRARRTRSGRVPKRLLPRTIQQKGSFEEGKTVYVKVRKRDKAPTPMYTLRRSVFIPKRFPFFERVPRLGAASMRRNFPRNLELSVQRENRPGRLR